MEKTIHGIENIPHDLKGCVLTIGNFDGVHLGHQMLVSTGKTLADKAGVPLVALTFNPPPDVVIRPYDKIMRVMPWQERARVLHKYGADYVVIVTADLKLLSMEPEDFAKCVIVDKFAPVAMVEGSDFCYGKKRAGNVATLIELGKENGFDVYCVPEVDFDVDGEPIRVSSTKIRELVRAGNIKTADAMLGRPFELIGSVVGGEQVGRVLEFPTANIDPGEQVYPAEGVYAGWAILDGEIFSAAISIGTKPTTGIKPLTIEANLIDATGDFYGKRMKLRFFRKLRDQQKFDSLDELKQYIADDVQKTREICPVELCSKWD